MEQTDTNTARRFGPVPPEEMTAQQRAIVDTISAGPRGRFGGPFDALLHSPDLVEASRRVGEYLRFATSLPTVHNELAILLTARRWTAQFEWHIHLQLALKAGLDPAIAEAVAERRVPAGLDADTAAVHRFVTELLDRGDVSDEAFTAVTDRWGKRGAADLIGVAGYYTFISFYLNVDRCLPPDGDLPLA